MSDQSVLDREHLLEKLEFALAISQAKGDKEKVQHIINQIKRIGFHYEEPGT